MIILLVILGVVYLSIALLIFDVSEDKTSVGFYLYFYGTPLAVGTFLLFAQKDPLLFLLTVSLYLMPFVGINVPPRSLGISSLNIISILVGLLILHRNSSARHKIDLVPYKILVIPLVAIIPSVLLSEVFYISLIEYFRILGYYALFIGFVHYVQNEGWERKFLYGIAIALLIVSISIIFEKLTGIDPSLTRHTRAITRFGGVLISRSSGLFQDPQKAAQFIAVVSVFLLVLVLRRVPQDKKLKRLIYIALLVTVPALLFTVTRASIYSWAAVVVFSVLWLNKYNAAGKIVLWSAGLFMLLLSAVIGTGAYKDMLPSDLRARIEKSEQHFEGRTDIWKETWYIFNDRPITGIGPGAYQSYLIRTNHAMRTLAQSGHAASVPNMPENGYLKILYETGVVGFMGLVVFVVSLLLGWFRELLRSKGSVKTMVYAVGMSGMVFLASFSTIFTLADARNAMLVILLLTAFVGKKSFSEV